MMPNHTKHAIFIARNSKAPERIKFAKKFMERMPLDCPGAVLNNMKIPGDQRMKNNHLIASEYKFFLAYENESVPGYCTEKIWWAFLGRSMPIYWGDPEIYDDFYQGSFINRQDFSSDKECLDYVEYLSNDDDEYLKILNNPKVKNHSLFSLSEPIAFLNKFLN
jgi:hypothetical protein